MTASCWLCATMVVLVFWIACMSGCCTCCHLSLLRGLPNAWATSCWKENEIMNGNYRDHVAFVWTWRRREQRLSFCRTFHPFIQHHDAAAVHRHTLRSPMSHFLHRRFGMGCQALNFRSRANYVLKMSRMHACWKNAQPLYNTLMPQPCAKPPRSGSAVLLDNTDPVCFSILQKWY